MSLLHFETNWTNSKQQILKNLIIIGLAWFLLFTAFQSMANLQSSLNSDQGVGTLSLSTIYITLVLSCLFLPALMINKIGLKSTIVTSQFAYLIFIAANVYPKWYLLLPTAAILGIFAGPLWTAKCTYLTEIAGFYSSLSGESNEAVVNRFFGIFFAMFQMSQIVGNLISSTVLKPEVSGGSEGSVNLESPCGSRDCPSSSEATVKKAQLSTVYTLCFIYIILGLLSIILIKLFLGEYKKPEYEINKKSDLLTKTLNQLKNKNQLLLIPLTLWMGFSLAFIGADFTKSFVACSKGVDKVGYAMICFGLMNVIGSYLFGQIVKFVGRVPCFVVGAVINYGMIILMLVWEIKKGENEYLLYVIPAFWGLADSAWQTQVNSIYGVLFQSNQEAAFSNFRLWESVGFAISYAYANYLCVNVKLYLLILYLTVGILGYFVVELNERNNINMTFFKWMKIFLWQFFVYCLF